MRYYYFLSYMYYSEKGITYANAVVDTKNKIKDSKGVQQLNDYLRKQGGHDSVNILNLTLIHRKWFT